MSEPRPADVAINHLMRTHARGAGRPHEDPEPDLSSDNDIPDDLIWPPPGLEHLHGLMTRVTGGLYLAALILIAVIALPVLLDRPPEIGSWGSVVAFVICGVMLWASYMWLMVMFNRAASGVALGYPRDLIWQVAADSARNSPQILRGSGAYERLDIAHRTALLRDRVTAGAFGLAGALWLTISIPILIAFAARGSMGTVTFWVITLLPAAFCVVLSVIYRIRDIRADYGNRIPDEEDRLTALQARGWSRLYASAGYTVEGARAAPGYRLAAGGAAFAVFMILIPIGIAAFSMIVPQVGPGSTNLYMNSLRASAFAPLRKYAVASPQIAEGFRLIDSATGIWDPPRGSIMVQQGAQQLADNYRDNGNGAEAARIFGIIDAANQAAVTGFKLARGSRSTLRALRSVVLDTSIPLAFRWQAYRTVTLNARCGSLTGIVFGPGRRHLQFVEAARSALVRDDEDEARFASLSTWTCGFGTVFRQSRRD